MRKLTPFRHPIDIRRDDRIVDLIAAHGHAGYGVYWMIVEILHSHEHMQLPYDVKAIRRMAAQVGMKHEEFHNLLQDMIHDFDLFEIADCQPDAGQQGFIRSTITYRKPRKPKQAAEPQHTAPFNQEAPEQETDNNPELVAKQQQPIRHKAEDCNTAPQLLQENDQPSIDSTISAYELSTPDSISAHSSGLSPASPSSRKNAGLYSNFTATQAQHRATATAALRHPGSTITTATTAALQQHFRL